MAVNQAQTAMGTSKQSCYIFILKIRSLLLFGSVSYHYSLSQELSHALEIQQTKSLCIIQGTQYRSYNNASLLTNLPRLETLREKACLQWALKAHLNPKHSILFPRKPSEVNTRFRKIYAEYFCHSARFYNSVVPNIDL